MIQLTSRITEDKRNNKNRKKRKDEQKYNHTALDEIN